MAGPASLSIFSRSFESAIGKDFASGMIKTASGILVASESTNIESITQSLNDINNRLGFLIRNYKAIELKKIRREESAIRSEEARLKFDEFLQREIEEEKDDSVVSDNGSPAVEEVKKRTLFDILKDRTKNILSNAAGTTLGMLPGSALIKKAATKIPGGYSTLGIVASGIWMVIDGFRGAMEFGGASGALGGLLGGMDNGLIGGFKNAGKWAMLGAGIGSFIPVIGTLTGGLVGAAAGFILGYIGGENISNFLSKIATAFQPMITIISNTMVPILTMVRMWWTAISTSFKALYAFYEGYQRGGIVEAIKGLIQTVIDSIKLIFNDFISLFSIKRLKEIFSSIWSLLLTEANFADSIGAFIYNQIVKTVGFIFDLINPLNWLRAIYEVAGKDTLIGWASYGIYNGINAVIDFIGGIFEEVKSFILNNPLVQTLSSMLGINLSGFISKPRSITNRSSLKKEKGDVSGTKTTPRKNIYGIDKETGEPLKVKYREELGIKLMNDQIWLFKNMSDTIVATIANAGALASIMLGNAATATATAIKTAGSAVATATSSAVGYLKDAILGNLATIRTKSGFSARVHKKWAANFQGFINDLEASGYKIKSLGGYSDRDVVGRPGRKSIHAFGGAIDINPATNPFRNPLITDLPSNIAAMAAAHGLGWGGSWKMKKDPMHFSVAQSEGGSVPIRRDSLVEPGYEPSNSGARTTSTQPQPDTSVKKTTHAVSHSTQKASGGSARPATAVAKLRRPKRERRNEERSSMPIPSASAIPKPARMDGLVEYKASGSSSAPILEGARNQQDALNGMAEIQKQIEDLKVQDEMAPAMPPVVPIINNTIINNSRNNTFFVGQQTSSDIDNFKLQQMDNGYALSMA